MPRPVGRQRSRAILFPRAPVAQWIELRTSDPTVVGSNPSRRARFRSRPAGENEACHGVAAEQRSRTHLSPRIDAIRFTSPPAPPTSRRDPPSPASGRTPPTALSGPSAAGPPTPTATSTRSLPTVCVTLPPRPSASRRLSPPSARGRTPPTALSGPSDAGPPTPTATSTRSLLPVSASTLRRANPARPSPRSLATVPIQGRRIKRGHVGQRIVALTSGAGAALESAGEAARARTARTTGRQHRRCPSRHRQPMSQCPGGSGAARSDRRRRQD